MDPVVVLNRDGNNRMPSPVAAIERQSHEATGVLRVARTELEGSAVG